jgi:hypothetical protein
MKRVNVRLDRKHAEASQKFSMQRPTKHFAIAKKEIEDFIFIFSFSAVAVCCVSRWSYGFKEA